MPPITNSSSSKTGRKNDDDDDDGGITSRATRNDSKKNPGGIPGGGSNKKFKLVVKRPRRRNRKPSDKRIITSSSTLAITKNNEGAVVVKVKPGLPNFPTELKEPPKDEKQNGDDDDDDEFDDLFPNLEDAIPCDTLLAFQSLTQQPSQQQQRVYLEIPLQASLDPIPCVVESQIIQVLNHQANQDEENDDNGFALVTREIPELIRKNTLRRLTSISTPGGSSSGGTSIEVLVLTSDYIRGVWDAHDMYTTTIPAVTDDLEGTGAAALLPPAPPPSEEERELQRCYIQWFVDHLYRFVGRVITESQLERIWNRYPPTHNLPYAMVVVSLRRAMDYFQKLQIVMVAGQQRARAADETSFQLWLPCWGLVLSALQKAQTKIIRKLQQTYQKEIAEKTILQQQQYHGIPIPLLLQLMRDQGKVKVVPKPYGNFIKLIVPKNKGETTAKGKRKR